MGETRNLGECGGGYNKLASTHHHELPSSLGAYEPPPGSRTLAASTPAHRHKFIQTIEFLPKIQNELARCFHRSCAIFVHVC